LQKVNKKLQAKPAKFEGSNLVKRSITGSPFCSFFSYVTAVASMCIIIIWQVFVDQYFHKET
jgi:hypothetical protein